MTWDSYDGFVKEMTQVISWCQQFMFITRAKELQEQAVARLGELLNKVRQAKYKAITDQAEEWARLLLLNEYITESFLEFGKMWIHIKNDEMDQAWDSLINAQMAVRHALLVRHDPELEKHNERLHLIESMMFPPQLFVSPGLVIEDAECSVCGKEYGECGHVKGRVYMGELCARIIKKFTIKEVSLVDEPADKHCRTLSFGKDGNIYDFMTLRLIADKSEGEKVFPSSPYVDE